MGGLCRDWLGKKACAAVFGVVLLGPSLLQAQTPPSPPCESSSPVPAYADRGSQPNVKAWSGPELSAWTPPACTGWASGQGNLVVALAGTIPPGPGLDAVLARFGAISSLQGLRYWSVTDKNWRVLVSEALALEGPESAGHRADFSPNELKSGRDYFFAQRDTRSTGEVTYRMRVREASATRLVLELENMTPVRYFMFTIFNAGGMKFLYFLDRRPDDGWNAYALLSANSSFAGGNEASFINRAGAFYRHFTGASPDAAPPLAP